MEENMSESNKELKNKLNHQRYIIGIDSWITNYCFGIWKNNKVEIIPNKLGDRITLSRILFKGIKKLFVKWSKRKLGQINPSMINFKRSIDLKVKEVVKFYPSKNWKKMVCSKTLILYSSR